MNAGMAGSGGTARSGATTDAAPPLVSLVTVTYQSARDIEEAIGSARAAAALAGCTLHVIVVDNASLDGSAEVAKAAAPDGIVIRNPENLGFGAASNQGIAVATGDHLLLLNPDARLQPDALGLLLAFMNANPEAALAAPSIQGPGGVESAGMAPGLRSFLGQYLLFNRVLPGGGQGAWRGFGLPRRRDTHPVPVEWASAAAVLLRADAIRAVGGFDPSIFLYGEDIELCERLRGRGWSLWLVPAARAWHQIGASQAGISTRWVDGLHRLYGRRAGRVRLALFDGILALGLGLRAVAARLRPPDRTGTGAGDPVHARRMAAGARRATRLALVALAGRAASDPQAPASSRNQAS
jgi:GT2 family glycosyltransferase